MAFFAFVIFLGGVLAAVDGFDNDKRASAYFGVAVTIFGGALLLLKAST